MGRTLRIVTTVGGLLIALAAAGPALAQKPGGVLKLSHFDSPASMSILEESMSSTRRNSPAATARTSGALLDLVRRRIGENRIIAPGSPWLFPSDSASGHVAEVRVDVLGALVGHALRHLYVTLALEAGVPMAELKFLLNHAVSSGGVTMGYLHPSLEHLRGWQEKATARILSAIGIACGPGCISGSLAQISPEMLAAR